MAGIFAGNIGQESLSRVAPWFLLAVVVLYFVGFVDGTVHGAAFGSASGAMAVGSRVLPPRPPHRIDVPLGRNNGAYPDLSPGRSTPSPDSRSSLISAAFLPTGCPCLLNQLLMEFANAGGNK